jgi:hypothetical protein
VISRYDITLRGKTVAVVLAGASRGLWCLESRNLSLDSIDSWNCQTGARASP